MNIEKLYNALEGMKEKFNGLGVYEKRLDQVESMVKTLERSFSCEVQKDPRKAEKEFDQWCKFAFLKKIPGLTTKAPSGMSEGTDADGGYLVPIEYSSTVAYVLGEAGLARKLFQIIPMKRKQMQFPNVTSNVTISWPGEGTAPSYTKPTLDKETLTAKKMLALLPVTSELLSDESYGLYALLFELVAWAMADEEDRVGFVGDTGSGDPFNGVLNRCSTEVAMDTGDTLYSNLNADYLADMTATLPSKYSKGGAFLMHRTILNYVRKLKNDEGTYIWQAPAAGEPGTIWGYPYHLNDNMPSTSVADGSQPGTSFVLFGNFKNVYLGDRKQFTVDSSKDYLFGTDELVLRFKERIALGMPFTAAICKLTTAAS